MLEQRRRRLVPRQLLQTAQLLWRLLALALEPSPKQALLQALSQEQAQGRWSLQETPRLPAATPCWQASWTPPSCLAGSRWCRPAASLAPPVWPASLLPLGLEPPHLVQKSPLAARP